MNETDRESEENRKTENEKIKQQKIQKKISLFKFGKPKKELLVEYN